MTKEEMMHKIVDIIIQYENSTGEIAGCFLQFPKKECMGFDDFEFEGEKFTLLEKVKIGYIKKDECESKC